MDDVTQKIGTCPTCRHAEHEGHICLNMASDSDCGCDKRPPKVVDDAAQKLVDEALFLAVDQFQSGLIDKMELIEAAEQWRHADRTPLAQRPPVSPEVLAGEVGYPMSPDDVDEAKSDEYAEGRASGYNDAFDNVMTALARFLVPSQPVYDEEKILRVLVEAARGPMSDGEWAISRTETHSAARVYAAALVAALRGGELTVEETNE